MRWRALMPCAVAAALLACGSKGSSNNDGSSAGNGGTVDPGVKNVSGSFVIGSADTPASGFELWIFDHTAQSIDHEPLDKKGAFSLGVERFTTGHTYSFHIIDDDRLIGDIDLSSANPGLQAAFTYDGGYGFDLGQIIIPLGTHGEIVNAGTSLVGTLGGGFGLDSSIDGSFSTFPLPSSVKAAALGSQLFVFDPQTLLYSFYNRATHPALYARDLQRLSRIGGYVENSADDAVSRVSVSEAGKWQAGARLATPDDVQPESATLWSATNYVYTATDHGRFDVSAFSDGLPMSDAVAIVRIRPADGSAESDLPLLIPRLVTFPPKLTAASGAGGSATAIDYTSATAVNGLTQPFCQTGDVVLDLVPPLDGAGAKIPATTLNTIDVVFDYYGWNSSKTTAITVTGDQLAAPYNAALTDTSITDVTRAWDPTKLKLTATLGTTVAGAATQEIRIWSDLFPSTIGSQHVSMIRLRIYYRSDSEATAGGIVAWFKHC